MIQEPSFLATNNFSIHNIVSENGEKATIVAYKGRLENRRRIAGSKFTNKVAWPDLKQRKEAQGVGKLKHMGVANLIGYFCAGGDERFLVPEYTPSETVAKHLFDGRVFPESVMYSFRTVLDLPSGKGIPPSRALVMVKGRNLNLLMDSHLVGLASQCLQFEPRERPSTKNLVGTFTRLQAKSDVPSNVMLRISKHEETLPTLQRPLSPMAAACTRMELTAIHQILVIAHYRDDKETQECTNGNITVSPTVYAARSLCHVFSDRSDAALLDAMQTQCAHPDWPMALYLQSGHIFHFA